MTAADSSSRSAVATMYVALHAAQNGSADVQATADDERELIRVGLMEWQGALAVAEERGATDASAAGLRLVPAGATLADEQSLSRKITFAPVLRTPSAPRLAIFFERVPQAEGARRKGGLIARRLLPTTYPRAQVPLTRRGGVGALSARARHPWFVARRTVPALAAWLQARAATRDTQRLP